MAAQSLSLVAIETPQWSLDLSSATTLRQYKKAQELAVLPAEAQYVLDPGPFVPTKVEFHDWSLGRLVERPLRSRNKQTLLYGAAPLCFDNGKLLVEIKIANPLCTDLKVVHFSREFCDGFVSHGNVIRGLIDFQNDLGDIDLRWQWTCQGQVFTCSFRFTVYSTKLDLQSDFQAMVADVQRYFQWLRLDLLRRTQWSLGSDGSPSTLQSWLSVFRRVEPELRRLYRLLLLRYRQRLRAHVQYVRADRMRNMPPRLEEEIACGIIENPTKKFRYESVVLNPDTVENRFVKAALAELTHDLQQACKVLGGSDKVSDSFQEWLSDCAVYWEKVEAHSFWKGVGAFRGMRQESLVMQRDPVYSQIKRHWNLLRHGLRYALLEEFAGGIQSVDQLYEVWCLSQLHSMLVNDLSWTEVRRQWTTSVDSWSELSDEKKGSKAWFQFGNVDHPGCTLYLLYQPFTGKSTRGWSNIEAMPVPQNPDIVLRLEKHDVIRTWVFDAKYRIEIDNRNMPKQGAPSDAIHQMHRYRDAIVWASKSRTQGHPEYWRESIGAYALFPGAVTDWDYHPQYESIDAVNIGAFPLHPKVDAGRELLCDFLREKLNLQGWDLATPLPKSVPMPLPLETRILIVSVTADSWACRLLQHGFYWLSLKEMEELRRSGATHRGCKYLAVRQTDSSEARVYAIDQYRRMKFQDLAHPFPSPCQEFIGPDETGLYLKMGDEVEMDIGNSAILPQLGVITWTYTPNP